MLSQLSHGPILKRLLPNQGEPFRNLHLASEISEFRGFRVAVGVRVTPHPLAFGPLPEAGGMNNSVIGIGE